MSLLVVVVVVVAVAIVSIVTVNNNNNDDDSSKIAKQMVQLSVWGMSSISLAFISNLHSFQLTSKRRKTKKSFELIR